MVHDFRCSNAAEMNFKLLAERTRYYKETDEGVRVMCRLNEEWLNSEKKTQALEIARNLINMAVLKAEEIAKATGLSVDEVKALMSEN